MKYIYLIVFFLLSLDLFALTLEAPILKEEFNRSDEIITGKVISIDSVSLSSNYNKIYIYNFKIYKSFKLKLDIKNIKVISHSINDINFELNKEYLVFLDEFFNLIYFSIQYSGTCYLKDVNESVLKNLDILSNNKELLLKRLEKDKYKKLLVEKISIQNKYFKDQIQKRNYLIGFTIFVILILLFYIFVKLKKKSF